MSNGPLKNGGGGSSGGGIGGGGGGVPSHFPVEDLYEFSE